MPTRRCLKTRWTRGTQRDGSRQRLCACYGYSRSTARSKGISREPYLTDLNRRRSISQVTCWSVSRRPSGTPPTSSWWHMPVPSAKRPPQCRSMRAYIMRLATKHQDKPVDQHPTYTTPAARDLAHKYERALLERGQTDAELMKHIHARLVRSYTRCLRASWTAHTQ